MAWLAITKNDLAAERRHAAQARCTEVVMAVRTLAVQTVAEDVGDLAEGEEGVDDARVWSAAVLKERMLQSDMKPTSSPSTQ